MGSGLARGTSGFRCANDGEEGRTSPLSALCLCASSVLGWLCLGGAGARWVLTSQLQVPSGKGACLSTACRSPREDAGVRPVAPQGEIRVPLEAPGKGRCLVGKVGGGLIGHLRQWRKEGPGRCGTGASPTFHLSRGILPSQVLGSRRWAVCRGRGMKALVCRRPPHVVPGRQHHKPSLGMGVFRS